MSPIEALPVVVDNVGETKKNNAYCRRGYIIVAEI